MKQRIMEMDWLMRVVKWYQRGDFNATDVVEVIRNAYDHDRLTREEMNWLFENLNQLKTLRIR